MALRARPQINVRRPGYLFAATRPNLLPGQNNNPTHGVSIGCGATGVEAGQKLGGPSLLFDPGVFSVPDAGTLGNLGRNTLISYCCLWLTTALHGPHELQSNRRERFRS